jgi:hypothetical protein
VTQKKVGGSANERILVEPAPKAEVKQGEVASFKLAKQLTERQFIEAQVGRSQLLLIRSESERIA